MQERECQDLGWQRKAMNHDFAKKTLEHCTCIIPSELSTTARESTELV